MDLKHKLLMSPLYDWLGKRSYAQSGEDIVADVELGRRKNGFYVDIGAYHPKLFSNTYLFYKRGWSGICVDPNPLLEDLYKKARPRDKFLNVGVGAKEDVAEYFMYEEAEANTFSVKQAEKNENEAGRKRTDIRMTAILPLRTVFAKYLPNEDIKIDLLSVDAEGMDEEILRSNDWKKFRPEVIICEDLDPDLDLTNMKKSPVVTYLSRQGYQLRDKTPYSLIFKLDD